MPILESLKNWEVSSYEDIGAALKTDALKSHLYDSEYWSRAWVTQAIVLARNFNVLTDATTLGLLDLSRSLKLFYPVYRPQFKSSRMPPFLTNLNDTDTIRRKYLIYLLNYFREKQCETT